MTLVLTGITLLAAGGLGAMYNVTEEPIRAAKAAKQEAAIKEVMPEYTTLDTAIIVDECNVFCAYDAEGTRVGMAIESSALGFGGNMKVMVGIDAEGQLVNYSLLEHAETPGLGTKAADWFKTKSDIRGKSATAGELKVNKDGGEVDAITAATISSRAFLATVNKAFAIYNKLATAPVEEEAPAIDVTAPTETINPDSIQSQMPTEK